MAEDLDSVQRYGQWLGLTICPRTVLVEGTSDVALFNLAARLEREATGLSLLGQDFTIVAAGKRDRGGTRGVIRELISFRAPARTCLQRNGRPRYRFVALFDNDWAGRRAVFDARQFDTSIREYKDVFRLQPIMPRPESLEPGHLGRTFDRENDQYSGLDWELEDMLPDAFVEGFLAECPGAVSRRESKNGKTHRDFTPDGKARLHRFVKQNAMREDLADVIEVLKAIRYYLGVK